MTRTATAHRRSLAGLDWFVFFVADIQTGWGPFVAAYLTSLAWTQFDIGLVLTIGTLSAFALQVPAGAIVDSLPAKRFLAGFAVACISGSALLLAILPTFNAVVVAKAPHATASCLLGPTIAAISLGLVGHSFLAFDSAGMSAFFRLEMRSPQADGMLGYYFSIDEIFYFTAALSVPTYFALAQSDRQISIRAWRVEA